MRILRAWRKELSEKAECLVYQIEGDLVVPLEVASDKEETAARTIRPKITKHLPEYLKV
jgi:deoxyribodipyrimidine photo-lyase